MKNSFTLPYLGKQALNGFKCVIAMLFISNISPAQINQSASSWSAAANNIYSTNSGNVGIGTSSPQYKLDVIGDVRISSNLFVGGGIVITDKVQATHEVTTMSMRADSIVMDQTKAIYGTTRIEGDIDAKNKMDVQGNATFNGTLKISNLSGSSISKVYSDQQGNLFKGPGVPPTWECINGTPNWNIGGNNFSGLSSGYPGLVDANIGTCDDNDFILKSNNNPKIWLKGAAGNEFIGFGTATPLDKFHFSGGDARFDNNVGIGTTSTPYRKLTVKGDVSFVNYGSTAGPGADAFEILGNSQIPTRRGISLEADPNGDMCFFINNYQGASGIPEFKFKNGIQSIPGANPPPMATSFANAPDLMVIDGLGKVTLNNYYGNATNDAFIIKNGNSGVINFKVKANGQTFMNQTIINSSGFASGADIFVITNDPGNIMSLNTNFKIKANGEVLARSIRVMVGNFPDYVFAKDYKLAQLSEVESFYNQNGRLPKMPGAAEVEKNGMDVGEINRLLVEKIEELTIYAVEQNKKAEAQQLILKKQEAALIELQKQISDLEKKVVMDKK